MGTLNSKFWGHW